MGAKAMAAGIQAQLVPAAIALGWVPRAGQRIRRGERCYDEFEFERLGADRIERIGFDFRYGDRPEVWIALAVWTGQDGACTHFETGDCDDCALYRRPWLWALRKLRRRRPPEARMAQALANGLRRLEITERYLRDGVKHWDLWLIPTVPPHRWPEGYDERMRQLAIRAG